jgi:hypothetical protein
VVAGASCGSVTGIQPATTYTDALKAELYWSYFEDNNYANGKWAWWFTVPNFLVISQA